MLILLLTTSEKMCRTHELNLQTLEHKQRHSTNYANQAGKDYAR